MSKKCPPYAPEFRRQMIELVRAGRTPEQLAKEFEPSARAIRNWVAQAGRDEGRREDGLTTVEREELNRLRRENRQLKLEREIYGAKGAAEVNICPPMAAIANVIERAVGTRLTELAMSPPKVRAAIDARGAARAAT